MRSTRFAGKKNPAVNKFLEGEHVDFLNLLVNTGIALSEIDDVNELLDHIVDTALIMGGCEGCSIYEAFGSSLAFLTTRNLVLEARNSAGQFKSFVIPIDGNTIAGHVAHSKKVVSIADVYNLPSDASFTFSPSFDRMVGYRSQSMLCIPMCDTKGNVLGVLQLINHVESGRVVPFPKAIEPYLRALASQVGIVLRNARMAAELKRSRIETVKRFVKASEYHDKDTGGHIERMSSYSAFLYGKVGYDAVDCEHMKLASMLHDVGKITIPDAVLKKPGRLTDEERVIMNCHATNGYEMLKDAESPLLQMGAIIAWTHHEKWDGSGYPRKLRGEDIPIEGRIVALADVFDALTSRRCYKTAWPLEEVLETIKRDAGTHFDPTLVQLFLSNLDEILAIRERVNIEFPTDAEPSQPPMEAVASAGAKAPKAS